jgi:hypothetical protein
MTANWETAVKKAAAKKAAAKPVHRFRKRYIVAAFSAVLGAPIILLMLFGAALETANDPAYQARVEQREKEAKRQLLWQSMANKCETKLVNKLRSPSTYKKVAVNHLPWSETEHSVTITYEAVNGFNAPIRSQEVCRYTIG